MPALSRKHPKALGKIALKKASGSQILSGLKIAKVEKLHAERAVASAERMVGQSSRQPKMRTNEAAGLRLQNAGLGKAAKAIK